MLNDAPNAQRDLSHIPLVKLDPKHPITLTGSSGGGVKRIEFPEPSYKLNKLLTARRSDFLEEDFDEDDQAIFTALETPNSTQQPQHEVIVIEDSPGPQSMPENDWKHDPEWVEATVGHLMPPPLDSSSSATMALQRELRAMQKEQNSAKSLTDLGWYMPPEFIGDNLFQWIVELHSFDEKLPVARDMKRQYVSSLPLAHRHFP